jgi:nitrite reductase/ring-hydroxylating ferredoxin subunit
VDTPTSDFVHAASLAELKAKGRLVVRGRHRPILLVHDNGRVFALDNRCPHMGFPLDRGSVEDGILTCHWHHARFDLASGCTFDLWADDVPACPVDIRAGEVWVKPVFGHADPAAHWRERLGDGLAHGLGLVIAKAAHGLLAAGRPPSDVVRQAALFGCRNRDGWGTGLTILTALGQLLPMLPGDETHLALFHGARRVAEDCDGAAPRRERAPLTSPTDLPTLKRWLRRWTAVRHREAAERTVLTAIAGGASPAELADLLLAAETDRAYADGGHSLDFINKAFECLDLIGWEHAADVLPSIVGQMTEARGADESTAWRQPADLIALCDEAARELPRLFAANGGAGRWSDHATLAERCSPPNRATRSRHSRLRRAPALLPRSRQGAGLRGGAQGGTVRHRERAWRLGDGASRLHLCQRAASRRSSGSATRRAVRSRRHAGSCMAPWRCTSRVTSTCRRRRCPARTATRSTRCRPASRTSAPPCSMPSIASNRSTRRRAWSPVTASLGHAPEALIATLAHALLREDAGFHACQMLEAGVRQFGEWGNGAAGRHILIAVARYLAAHSPTERAALQTADIARRLMRGGELHQGTPAAG